MSKRICLGSLIVLAAASGAQAFTVTLLATQDTEYSVDHGTTGSGSCGKSPWINVDLWQSMSTPRRSLVQWDLSGLPADALIGSAQVRIYGVDTNTGGQPFSVYKVTSPWTEGNGMTNAQPGAGFSPAGANWDYSAIETQTRWTTPGGDADPSSRVPFTGEVAGDPVNGGSFVLQPVITAIARSWLGGPNNGILIVSDESAYQRHRLCSRDYGYSDDGQNRPSPGLWAPQLVITYTLAPAHPGDANKDGLVDLQDFGLLKDHFGITAGAAWEQGDFNADGAIDLQDFGILKEHFGHTAGSNPLTGVPEPATLSFLAAGAWGLAARRRPGR